MSLEDPGAVLWRGRAVAGSSASRRSSRDASFQKFLDPRSWPCCTASTTPTRTSGSWCWTESVRCQSTGPTSSRRGEVTGAAELEAEEAQAAVGRSGPGQGRRSDPAGRGPRAGRADPGEGVISSPTRRGRRRRPRPSGSSAPSTGSAEDALGTLARNEPAPQVSKAAERGPRVHRPGSEEGDPRGRGPG